MNIPNIITVSRILLVPVIVYLILTQSFSLAFALFVIAGVSDGLDGFLAKHFHMDTELGAYLDPVADKTLLVSIFVALGLVGHVPLWLVIAVVSRDILIIGGVVMAWMIGRPLTMRPLVISKINTAVQIGYASLVLAGLAFGILPENWLLGLSLLTGGLTIASACAYLISWTRHMARASDTDGR